MSLSNTQNERLLDLLIEMFDNTGDAEGVYFMDDDKLIEALELINLRNPSKERSEHIEWLKKKFNK